MRYRVGYIVGYRLGYRVRYRVAHLILLNLFKKDNNFEKKYRLELV